MLFDKTDIGPRMETTIIQIFILGSGNELGCGLHVANTDITL